MRILKDRDGSSKGVAYIKYGKTSEAAIACETMNGEQIDNSSRPIKVLIAASRQMGSGSAKNREDEKSQRLFIITPKGIALLLRKIIFQLIVIELLDFTEEKLTSEFGTYGAIDDVTIVRDRQTRDGKQFAYIKFKK